MRWAPSYSNSQCILPMGNQWRGWHRCMFVQGINQKIVQMSLVILSYIKSDGYKSYLTSPTICPKSQTILHNMKWQILYVHIFLTLKNSDGICAYVWWFYHTVGYLFSCISRNFSSGDMCFGTLEFQQRTTKCHCNLNRMLPIYSYWSNSHRSHHSFIAITDRKSIICWRTISYPYMSPHISYMPLAAMVYMALVWHISHSCHHSEGSHGKTKSQKVSKTVLNV